MTSGVPQGSVLGQMLFNVLLDDTDSGIKWTLSRFEDGTKQSGAVGTTEGQDDIQGDQACEMGPQESDKVEQVQVQSPASGKSLT